MECGASNGDSEIHEINNNNITEILKYVPWAREGGCYSYTIPKDPKSHSPGCPWAPQ
jgi:hypothetical protein